MKKLLLVLALVMALLVIAAVPAFADGPSFEPGIYADGELFSTKGTADLPAPNEHNRQSFDGLFKFPGVDVQTYPVAEAAPGNPDYNGGRWEEYTVEWNVDPVLVTSYEQLMALEAAGDVTITPTGNYFQCPLLPPH